MGFADYVEYIGQSVNSYVGKDQNETPTNLTVPGVMFDSGRRPENQLIDDWVHRRKNQLPERVSVLILKAS